MPQPLAGLLLSFKPISARQNFPWKTAVRLQGQGLSDGRVLTVFWRLAWTRSRAVRRPKSP